MNTVTAAAAAAAAAAALLLEVAAVFQQDRQCGYNVNIQARSRNHCCCSKAVLRTSTMCVCSLTYAARKAPAPS
jgi:hypothetical protein